MKNGIDEIIMETINERSKGINKIMNYPRGNTGRVLKYLQENDSINSTEAFELFGVTRLSTIIYNLRKYGYYIINQNCESKNKYGEKVRFVKYKLIK